MKHIYCFFVLAAGTQLLTGDCAAASAQPPASPGSSNTTDPASPPHRADPARATTPVEFARMRPPLG